MFTAYKEGTKIRNKIINKSARKQMLSNSRTTGVNILAG